MDLLKKIKRTHMIGIKGTGMSALAVNLKQMGIRISGSDYPESFFTDSLLKKNNIKVDSPFAPKNIPFDADVVVVSTAYNNKNEEVQEAERRGLQILYYPEMVGLLSKALKSIAVCGSHGKTTTSGALGFILSKTKYSPIVNVGSIVPQLIDYTARAPKLFVFEADEYQNKFEYFNPRIVILTNIDFDHPDFFSDPRHYKSVFQKFVARIPENGLLIYCADDKNCRDVAKKAICAKVSYGFSKYADFRLKVNKILPGRMLFSITTPDQKIISLATKLIGNHNALNLAASFVCARSIGMPLDKIKKEIAGFAGTKRRLEVIKKTVINNYSCLIIDDYAHHPTEIENTISALKKAYPDKILWAVFQPHTFSRTEALLENFARAFNESDKTVILDIYASKRETDGKIHSRDLVKKIASPDVFYKPDIARAVDFIKKRINKESIILSLGAGNVWKLATFL